MYNCNQCGTEMIIHLQPFPNEKAPRV